MHPVNRLAYRGQEVNLGGDVCMEKSGRKKRDQLLEEQGWPRRVSRNPHTERFGGSLVAGMWLCGGGPAPACSASLFSRGKSQGSMATQQSY